MLTSEGAVGAERWTHVTRVPIRDASGAVTHLATIERDVTEQKSMEARLRQSDKMQALGTLAGGIAHDFNNLLTAILGSLELAGPKVAEQPRVQRLIENARGAAERGASLTKRLLSFSRAHDLQARATDVNALIGGMSDLFSRSLGGLVSVRTELAPDLPPAQVDPDQLELAVLNLCINARDAMPDGGAITIATRRMTISDDPEIGDGEYCGIRVTDEGTGIPEEILRRVCEPFFTTKAIGQGTGLGLAMVFGLAQQSKGRLVIESEVGRGTQVELALPFAAVVPAEKVAGEAVVPAPSRPARILVVDDDPEVRHVTASFLAGFGYDETEACDGPAALAMLKQERFDLVVADLAMPGMSGVELASEVRAREPGLPILILTGHADAMQIPTTCRCSPSRSARPTSPCGCRRCSIRGGVGRSAGRVSAGCYPRPSPRLAGRGLSPLVGGEARRQPGVRGCAERGSFVEPPHLRFPPTRQGVGGPLPAAGRGVSRTCCRDTVGYRFAGGAPGLAGAGLPGVGGGAGAVVVGGGGGFGASAFWSLQPASSSSPLRARKGRIRMAWSPLR